MPFITLTTFEEKHMVIVRPEDVRVLEEQTDQKIFENGEWKTAPLPATLITLFNGTQYTVVEQAADILKKLEKYK